MMTERTWHKTLYLVAVLFQHPDMAMLSAVKYSSMNISTDLISSCSMRPGHANLNRATDISGHPIIRYTCVRPHLMMLSRSHLKMTLLF